MTLADKIRMIAKEQTFTNPITIDELLTTKLTSEENSIVRETIGFCEPEYLFNRAKELAGPDRARKKVGPYVLEAIAQLLEKQGVA